MLFYNGPEYEARLRKPFSPPQVTLKEIHDAVPKELLQKNQLKATYYVLRDVALTAMLYKFAYSITPWAATDFGGIVTSTWQKDAVKSVLWSSYWVTQGLVGAGIFCLAHDAGHSSLYHSNKVNNIVGFLLHTYLLIPYFAWRSSHHSHHKATSSMERDEAYVPYTRTTFQLPDESVATPADYSEVFEETPFVTLCRMLIMQGLGWWAYLSKNTMGSPSYPKGTNHFNPSSPLFKDSERKYIVMSNVGLGTMAVVLYLLGSEFFLWYYLVPYLFTNNWIVMFTFIQHSDPTVPHYRKGEWTFLRGAAATVDRPFFGWVGRVFLHNISHDHVAHHFFLRAPFFNGPQITEALKGVLKDDYNYDSTPALYALYRSFTQCVFVEDEGDIVFYKNKAGIAARRLAPSEKEMAGAKELEAMDGNGERAA